MGSFYELYLFYVFMAFHRFLVFCCAIFGQRLYSYSLLSSDILLYINSMVFKPACRSVMLSTVPNTPTVEWYPCGSMGGMSMLLRFEPMTYLIHPIINFTGDCYCCSLGRPTEQVRVPKKGNIRHQAESRARSVVLSCFSVMLAKMLMLPGILS